MNFTTIVRNELNHNMICEVVLRSNNLDRVIWILRNCIKAVLIFKRELERIKLVKEGASADKNKISTEKSEVHNDDTTPAIMNEGQNNDESPTLMNEVQNNEESPTLMNDVHNNDDSPTLMNEVHVSQKLWALFGNRWYTAELADPDEWPDELENQLKS